MDSAWHAPKRDLKEFAQYVKWDIEDIMSMNSAHYKQQRKWRITHKLAHYFSNSVPYFPMDTLQALYRMISRNKLDKRLIPVVKKAMFMQTYMDTETGEEIFQKEYQKYSARMKSFRDNAKKS